MFLKGSRDCIERIKKKETRNKKNSSYLFSLFPFPYAKNIQKDRNDAVTKEGKGKTRFSVERYVESSKRVYLTAKCKSSPLRVDGKISTRKSLYSVYCLLQSWRVTCERSGHTGIIRTEAYDTLAKESRSSGRLFRH